MSALLFVEVHSQLLLVVPFGSDGCWLLVVWSVLFLVVCFSLCRLSGWCVEQLKCEREIELAEKSFRAVIYWNGIQPVYTKCSKPIVTVSFIIFVIITVLIFIILVNDLFRVHVIAQNSTPPCLDQIGQTRCKRAHLIMMHSIVMMLRHHIRCDMSQLATQNFFQEQ